MSARKLKRNVVLREFATSLPQSFGPDTKSFPKWAQDQLDEAGDHIFEPYDAVAAYKRVSIPAPSGQVQGRDYESAEVLGAVSSKPIEEDLDEPAEEDSEEPEVEVPGRNQSKATWKAFAKKAIADGYPVVLNDDQGRDDIIKALEEAEVIERED